MAMALTRLLLLIGLVVVLATPSLCDHHHKKPPFLPEPPVYNYKKPAIPLEPAGSLLPPPKNPNEVKPLIPQHKPPPVYNYKKPPHVEIPSGPLKPPKHIPPSKKDKPFSQHKRPVYNKPPHNNWFFNNTSKINIYELWINKPRATADSYFLYQAYLGVLISVVCIYMRVDCL